MKTKRNVQALLRQLTGKDAAAILNKIEKMLKKGVPRAQIEKVLVAALSAHTRKHIKWARAGLRSTSQP